MAKKILVTQTGSTARRPPKQLLTLKALGLGRIGKSCEHEATASTVGMLKAVAHLVNIEELKGSSKSAK